MDAEKFTQLMKIQAEARTLDNHYVVSDGLIEDYKRQARASEREHIIEYLKSLLTTTTNLYGAIVLLEGNHDKD